MQKLAETLDKLSKKSKRHYCSPYDRFDWPDSISTSSYWMSPELLSVYDTEFWDELPEEQRNALSKWEMVSFLSLNIHGIKDLLFSVIDLIHTDTFEDASEYFHHFIDEENNHMWFFAEFCRRYAKKMYENKRITLDRNDSVEAEHFITFSRILIFEKMVAYYNQYMMKDGRLDPILQGINKMHFSEESRHLAMGQEMIRVLGKRVRESDAAPTMAEIRRSLDDYATLCVNSFYNPAAYRDAGIAEPYAFRRKLLAHPARRKFNEALIRDSMKPFGNWGKVAA
ncbi:MAG: diiron oxygenase [Kiloniellales bacterium]